MTSSPLLFLPAHELAKKLAAGDSTSEELVNLYLDQIDKHNLQGLKLRAIISTCPREIAVKQAQKLDQERKEGKLRGKLHGIPIVVKDAIVTGPELGMPSTSGSPVHKYMKAKKSATMVDRLRDAGMIIIAKANMTEYCGLKNNDTPIGYSTVGGQTLSAYRREGLEEKEQPTSGGSSSGSAVSLTAGFAPLSIGTQTGGSAVYPAGVNGVYCIKATHGSIPVDGMFKLSHSFDGIGPMAKDPEDLAELMTVVMNKDTVPAEGFAKIMERGFEGLKIGVLSPEWGSGGDWGKQWRTEEAKSEWERAVETMKKHGAKVTYPLEDPKSDMLDHNGANLHTIAYHEISSTFDEYIACFEPHPEIKSLKDIVEWNKKHAKEAMPDDHPGQSELIACAEDKMSDATHDEALATIRRKSRKQGMAKFMAEDNHDLDLVLASSNSNLVSHAAWDAWPVGVVPLNRWKKNGEPWGMFALAKEGREDVLLRFMKGWEGAFGKIDGPVIP